MRGYPASSRSPPGPRHALPPSRCRSGARPHPRAAPDRECANRLQPAVGRAEATLIRQLSRAKAGRTVPRLSAAAFRDLLDRTLTEIDRDERGGSLLRATGLRMRFRLPDLGLVLNVAPSEERDHHLRWTFAKSAGWKPSVELIMNSQVANSYLQGKESLAIAIARGRAKYRGETRCALLYVPAMRVVVDAYRSLVRKDHPELVI